MNEWEYAIYNMRRQRKERVDALIKKYGYPINERDLREEDYFEYDLLKDDLEAMNAINNKQDNQDTPSIDYSKYGDNFSREFINKMLSDRPFQTAMGKYTRKNEGGLANHKNDTGGFTNMGITKKYYPDENIKELTRERADALLYRDYWVKTKIFQLPDEISGIVFDNAVVQGPPTAIRNLQKALGVKADGLIGPNTLSALKNADYDEVKKAFIKNVHKREDIIIKNNPSQKIFEEGHRNRYNRYY